MKGGSSCQDKTKHKRNTLQRAVNYCTYTCLSLSVVVIRCRSAVYIFTICNKIRVHVYFYAPPSGPVKSEPHILPDHRVCGQKLPRASTREISPLCVCKKKKSWPHVVTKAGSGIQLRTSMQQWLLVRLVQQRSFFFIKREGEEFCLPTWLRVLCVFCSHTLHWSYSLIDTLLQPDACLRTHPKNCLSSRRRVEFCSPGLGSHEPLCSRSERGGGGGGGGGKRQRRERMSKEKKR